MVNTAEIIPQNFIPWSGNLRIIISKFTHILISIIYAQSFTVCNIFGVIVWVRVSLQE